MEDKNMEMREEQLKNTQPDEQEQKGVNKQVLKTKWMKSLH